MWRDRTNDRRPKQLSDRLKLVECETSSNRNIVEEEPQPHGVVAGGVRPDPAPIIDDRRRLREPSKRPINRSLDVLVEPKDHAVESSRIRGRNRSRARRPRGWGRPLWTPDCVTATGVHANLDDADSPAPGLPLGP